MNARPSDDGATSVVIGSVVVIAATTMVRNLHNKEGKPLFQPIVYGFLLMIVLLIIAIFSPRLAKGLALMGIVGAFVVNGPALFNVLDVLHPIGNPVMDRLKAATGPTPKPQ